MSASLDSFPCGSDSKESACKAGDPGSIPGLGRSSGEGNGNPLQYSGLENPHGQWSLVGYSPWDSPGKNTGVGCHSLPQRIFLTQGSNPGLLHCRQILCHLSYREDVRKKTHAKFSVVGSSSGEGGWASFL